MECSELFYNFIFIDFFDKHIHKDEEDLKERSTQKKEKGMALSTRRLFGSLLRDLRFCFYDLNPFENLKEKSKLYTLFHSYLIIMQK